VYDLSIDCCPSYGPTFGNDFDIHVGEYCDQNTSNWRNLGIGYTNDTGIDGQQVFTGQYTFQVA
jgi:hypothetical protein